MARGRQLGIFVSAWEVVATLPVHYQLVPLFTVKDVG